MAVAWLQRLRRRAIRAAMRVAFRLHRAAAMLRGGRTRGVRAIALTPEGAIVLVHHSYMPGWHLPGGGWKAKESAAEACLRELREEIGLRGHTAITPFADYRNDNGWLRDTVSVFVVEGVVFDPRHSLEIEGILAFPLDALPGGLIGKATARRIAEWRAGEPASERW